MKRLFLKNAVAALALLGSSAVMAASVLVTATDPNPTVGSTFSINVHGDGFPNTVGATLGLVFNANVQVTNIGLASGSPFTGGTVPGGPIAPGGFTSGSLVTVLGPLFGALPSGSFDAFVVTFQALAAGPAGIQLVDDGAIACWTDENFSCIPATYTQASVNVTAPVVPVPGAVWLLVSALGSMAGLKRLRRA